MSISWQSNPAAEGAEAAYFSVRYRDGEARAEGMTNFHAGHTVPDSYGEPNGAFASWQWDGSSLTVTTDRYGVYPLFYRIRSQEIAVAVSLSRLVKGDAPKRIDPVALSLFLLLGNYLGCDTPFEDIRCLPPGGRLLWAAGELKVTEHLPRPAANTLTRNEAIDAFIELFRRAIAKHLVVPFPIALGLSGGRDSRHILLELCRLGHPPALCVTSGYLSLKEDLVIARMLAARLGVKHAATDKPGAFVNNEFGKNLKTNFMAQDHGWFTPVARLLCRQGATLFDGLGGDVLSAGVFMTPDLVKLFEDGRLAALADRIVPPEAALDDLLPDSTRPARADLLDRVVPTLREHVDTPNPVASFFFWNRTRRGAATAPFCLLGAAPAVFAPYLDHDVWDLLASLPSAFMLDHRFHDDAIRRAFPEFANVPFAKKTVVAAGHTRRMEALTTLRAVMAHRKGLLLNAGGCAARLALLALRPNPGMQAHWFARQALYVLQLENLMCNEHMGKAE